jgi:hypothetical protein
LKGFDQLLLSKAEEIYLKCEKEINLLRTIISLIETGGPTKVLENYEGEVKVSHIVDPIKELRQMQPFSLPEITDHLAEFEKILILRKALLASNYSLLEKETQKNIIYLNQFLFSELHVYTEIIARHS